MSTVTGDAGAPFPMVFLPGAGGRPVWAPVVARLPSDRDHLMVSYPGLANTPPNPALRSLNDLYKSIFVSLPEQFDLVAFSMGCVLALRAAIEQPQRIRRLALVATSGGLQMAPFGARDWRKNWREEHPNAPTWFVDDDTDFSQRFQHIAAPTLLIFGAEDAIAPPAVGEFILQRLPRAELKVIVGATHEMHTEFPDEIAQFIDSHFSSD